MTKTKPNAYFLINDKLIFSTLATYAQCSSQYKAEEQKMRDEQKEKKNKHSEGFGLGFGVRV